MPGPNDRLARDDSRQRRERQVISTKKKLIDNSGGTASETIPAVPAAYSQATFQTIIASLTQKLNALLNERST